MILEIELKLKQFRNARGLTLKELSQLCGIPKSTLQCIENGKTEPKLRHLIYIAYSYGVHPDELYSVKKIPSSWNSNK